ncbi:hypothetical protein LTR37_011769 [Vermiconidia calcicola]|uniref:Uncharacterized protein n=1 Tax=Vermiconidia calcicola TaxID=1690605 RepID=A0ACC3N3X7_9PEZI|nr:hypothetical protein LTR37_011769 [Vermiconidia calcicola]
MAPRKPRSGRPSTTSASTKAVPTKVTKRKASTQPRGRPAKLPATTFIAQADSALLNLPAETRNQIYGQLVERVRRAYVVPRTKGSMVTRPPMFRVSRQTRAEFGNIQCNPAPITATFITMNVVDLNFSAMQSFMNRLPKTADADDDPDAPKQTFKIDITITAAWSAHPDPAALLRWFSCIKDKVRKGVELEPYDFIYTFKRVEDKEQTRRAMHQIIYNGTFGWVGGIELAFDKWMENAPKSREDRRMEEEMRVAQAELDDYIDNVLDVDTDDDDVEPDYGRVAHAALPTRRMDT